MPSSAHHLIEYDIKLSTSAQILTAAFDEKRWIIWRISLLFQEVIIIIVLMKSKLQHPAWESLWLHWCNSLHLLFNHISHMVSSIQPYKTIFQVQSFFVPVFLQNRFTKLCRLPSTIIFSTTVSRPHTCIFLKVRKLLLENTFIEAYFVSLAGVCMDVCCVWDMSAVRYEKRTSFLKCLRP